MGGCERLGVMQACGLSCDLSGSLMLLNEGQGNGFDAD